MSDEPKPTRTYNNDEITVVWKAGLCTHCENCIQGLPQVFNLMARPWVNMQGSSTENIIAQVNDCPTGALTIERKNHA